MRRRPNGESNSAAAPTTWEANHLSLLSSSSFPPAWDSTNSSRSSGFLRQPEAPPSLPPARASTSSARSSGFLRSPEDPASSTPPTLAGVRVAPAVGTGGANRTGICRWLSRGQRERDKEEKGSAVPTPEKELVYIESSPLSSRHFWNFLCGPSPDLHVSGSPTGTRFRPDSPFCGSLRRRATVDERSTARRLQIDVGISMWGAGCRVGPTVFSSSQTKPPDTEYDCGRSNPVHFWLCFGGLEYDVSGVRREEEGDEFDLATRGWRLPCRLVLRPLARRPRQSRMRRKLGAFQLGDWTRSQREARPPCDGVSIDGCLDFLLTRTT